ncbi:FAD binding domain-containing protein [Desulfotalea psychrophila]|uniref:Related to 4-hydroxybenzoyl-CoA reductase (HcrB) n=1 Tax=Desulfotalea psychrophila (strain LSv54 / DSM 12343) TaxID=177439 RepID=Q6AIN3_DESPS|nr:FAD binding domain-containing protein [Desulfotalea psychrophila]CAG37797.1 related to 4-hydroxybenzoyl-CoA reductase (HcrB) [Desulfotalea psychrophila LSv54]
MFKIGNYLCPSSLEDAYQVLQDVPASVVLGGCGYLRLAGRRIDTAIDLVKLGLDTVVDSDSSLEIGAMTSLREIETNPLILEMCQGLLSRSVKNIVGVQLRNCVTIGGSVMGRYPFSDPITALVALDAELLFHGAGRVRLTDYLLGKGLRDILLKIIIPKGATAGSYTSVRKSATDYAILNVAVSQVGKTYRIVVGSRPGRSLRANLAEIHLGEHGLSDAAILKAAQMVVEELKFGDNPRGSEAYRRAVCPALVKRCLMEVRDAA